MSDTMGAEAFWESIGPTSATWATSAARYEDLKRAAEEAGQCTGKHWSEAFTDREADALLPFLESVGGVSESLFVAPLSDASGAQEWAHFLTLYERDLETLRASKERRADLRRMAALELDAMGKAAKQGIDAAELETITAIVAVGMGSEARELLAAMPTVEELIPALDVQALEDKAPATESRGYVYLSASDAVGGGL